MEGTDERSHPPVRALRGPDAGFLYVESRDQPVTIPFLVVLSAADGTTPDPLSFDALRAQVASRIDAVPALRWRIVRAPLGLHRPFLAEDPEFDLDFHLRHVRLPAPGTAAQLDRLVADGAERRLDRRHPLWQLTLVDGLEGGRQAIYLRGHHAMADGIAVRTIAMRLFSDAPFEPEPRGPILAKPGPAIPGTIRPVPRKVLVKAALADQWQHVKQLPALVADTKRRFEAVKGHEHASPITVPALTVDTPVCSINDAYSGGRVYARTQLALADVLAVKRAADVTVNAVLLALVGSALRTYLAAHDDLPDRPLTANVPVGTDPPGATERDHGNYFANHLATLATDEPDAWRRLQTIATVADESRARLDILGTDTIVRWLDFIPSIVGEPGGKRIAAHRREHPEKVDFSVLVSNVPGPREQVRFGPVVVDEMYISGPTTDGEGVNVTTWGYGDTLFLAVLAHAEALADPRALLDGIRAALDELLVLAAAATTVNADPGTEVSS